MKVTVVRGGGLAGLVSEWTLDSTALTEDEAGVLRRLVAGARGSTGDAPPPGTTATAPDQYAYEVSIEDDDGAAHRFRSTDTTAPEAMRALIGLVRSDGGRGSAS